ncbi:palmitoyl-protein thioesterase 1 [Tetranychus urticae]|uniref:AB hydrolase-1 domain-containing protein n=1 Tax=Tetranychus urticae TaxID=32264 RepID=T1L3N7_TETUR|nr:palmitoyl-protein thioesterase 1 [Tetranychus urticae]
MDSKLLRFTCLLICICWVNLTKSVDGSPPAKKPLTTVVVWHGAGKSTTPAENTVRSFEKYGAKVKSIQIGTEEHELDIALHMRMDKQVMNVCRQLTNDPELKNGFALIGHSLGGTAARGLVQMCPELNITDVISMCGPQQGIFGIPNCQIIEDIFTGICDKLDAVQEAAASIAPGLDTPSIFTPIMNVIGNNATLPGLWVDPNACAPSNNFVNLINNRLPSIKFPKENLLKVQRFIAVWCSGDTIMKPKESPMFGWFKEGSETEVIPYNETDLYTEDYIGLKELDEQGRFFTVECPYEHMQYSNEWFEKNIIERFYDV